MTESNASSRINVNYIELPGGPIEMTKRFYADAFGWAWSEYGPTYAAYEHGDVTIGLNAQAAAARAPDSGAQDGIGPLVLFETDDLDATIAAVRAASGEITSEPYGYPGGHRFHFRDPAGNTLGIYQSAATPG